MLKRFVARLLIITQIYSNLFQSMVVHAATLVDEGLYHRHLLERSDELGIDDSAQSTALPRYADVHISSFNHLYSAINQ